MLQACYVQGRPGNLDAITLHPLPARGPERLRTLGLTARQAEVLHLLWQGATNANIAVALDISPHTVRHHLEQIYSRIGVNTRTAACHKATHALAGARLPPPPPGDPE